MTEHFKILTHLQNDLVEYIDTLFLCTGELGKPFTIKRPLIQLTPGTDFKLYRKARDKIKESIATILGLISSN